MDAESESDRRIEKDGRGSALHRLRARMPGRNVWILVLSLGLGCLGALTSMQYIETQVDSVRGEYEQQESMVQVVVPNRSLDRGHVLSADDLSVREIPARYADSNSVGNTNYKVALGQRLGFPIDQGRPLLWAHLEGGLTPTFSGKVRDGHRAMTVRVDDVNSISGFLQPGDRIDLLLSHGHSESQMIFPLIQNLSVIATGVQTRVDKTAAVAQRHFPTITVDVTPDQAQKITLAQQFGRLTAMLRNPDDVTSLSSEPMTVSQLLGLSVKEPVRPSNTPRQASSAKTPRRRAIEYIIGGS